MTPFHGLGFSTVQLVLLFMSQKWQVLVKRSDHAANFCNNL